MHLDYITPKIRSYKIRRLTDSVIIITDLIKMVSPSFVDPQLPEKKSEYV